MEEPGRGIEGLLGETSETVVHKTGKVGAEDENVEACGTRDFVVQIPRGALTEGNARIRCPSAIPHYSRSFPFTHPVISSVSILGGTNRGGGPGWVQAQQKFVIAGEESTEEFQVRRGGAVQDRQLLTASFQLLAKATQFHEGEFRIADEAEVGA